MGVDVPIWGTEKKVGRGEINAAARSQPPGSLGGDSGKKVMLLSDWGKRSSGFGNGNKEKWASDRASFLVEELGISLGDLTIEKTTGDIRA